VSRTFNGEEHKNCSATRTGLRAIPCDAQGVEGKKETAAITVFLKRKEENKKTQKTLLGGGAQLFADFYFSQEVLEAKPLEKRGMSVW
jgi:hypothetical protein